MMTPPALHQAAARAICDALCPDTTLCTCNADMCGHPEIGRAAEAAIAAVRAYDAEFFAALQQASNGTAA